MLLGDYESVLYTWINDREYTKLGWERDEYVRDTGPFVLGGNYGTHPAVRIYYSNEVYRWLKQGRKGELPVGSMIVKEMFNPPAARLEEQREAYGEDTDGFDTMVEAAVTGWTIMIRDDQTVDGWFWAGAPVVSRKGKTPQEYAAAIASKVDTDEFPFDFRDSNHGLAPCLRCHASAERESTFSSLENIEGDGLRFRVDESWRTGLPKQQRPAGGETEVTLASNAFHGDSSSVSVAPDGRNLVDDALPAPNPVFVEYFKLAGVAPPTQAQIKRFPGQWADHVPAGHQGPEQFLTSDNCLGCHGGLGGAPFGVNMFLQTGSAYGQGYNISPFGEWRWSPMGLAGRDPAFFSQLATELAILDKELSDPQKRHEAKNAVVNTCLSCHGAMGQRQLMIDAVKDPSLDPNFLRQYVYAHDPLEEAKKKGSAYRHAKYGNLAREGISCTVCHHIKAPPDFGSKNSSEEEKLENFLFNYTTGQFLYTEPDVIEGPFDHVKAKPMEQSLGITPRQSAFIRDSQMCGTCHVINLPNIDGTEFKFPELDKSAKAQAKRLKDTYGVDYAEVLTPFPHSIEQATFLEWQNSSFASDSKQFKSCQDCHMPGDFHSLDGEIAIDQLTSQIASIQDSSYPEAEHDLPSKDVDIPYRNDYRRHELVGLNVFLLEMFDQFDALLGVAITDPMTFAATGNQLAIENMVRQAQDDTIELDVEVVSAENGKLTADVTVANLVGHRFPSGVAFRRTWIEFLVLDGSKGGEVIWGSGRTNTVGLIVDEHNKPLVTEFFGDDTNRIDPPNPQWQPHYHGIPTGDLASENPPVTSESEVQIYEEVTLNAKGEVTFSFIHRDKHVKDNRLLPRGWQASRNFPSGVLREFMESTDPVAVGGDPDYDSVPDFKGVDHVRYIVTLPPETDLTDLSVQVTMYYQAFQPFWLQEKFRLSPESADTQRLYFMASHLNTEGTIIDNWKLPLVSVEKPVVGTK